MIEFLSRHWGDVASVAGTGIGLIGFLITICLAMKAKNAAQAAQEAADSMKADFHRFDLVHDFAQVFAIMEELKRLHSANAWPILPDRYSTIRRL